MIKNILSLKALASAHLLKKRTPLSVTHIITTRCNMRCSYCEMYKHQEQEMDTVQIKRILEEMARMGCRRYGISGGEPLVREDIGEIVSHAKKLGLITSLFTNGLLMKQRIDDLKDLDIILISFDGPEDVHDMNRQKGAYKAAMSAIKLARKRKKTVWTGLTLTKNNHEHVQEILKTAKKLGFSVMVQPIYHYQGYSTSKAKVQEMSAENKDINSAIDKIMSMKKKGFPVLNSYTYFKYMKTHSQVPNSPCWASKLYCALTPDGNVSPCFKIYNQKKWPSAVDMGFKEAFLSLPKKVSCSGCYSYATTESNLFYSLYPEVIYNTYFRLIKH